MISPDKQASNDRPSFTSPQSSPSSTSHQNFQSLSDCFSSVNWIAQTHLSTFFNFVTTCASSTAWSLGAISACPNLSKGFFTVIFLHFYWSSIDNIQVSSPPIVAFIVLHRLNHYLFIVICYTINSHIIDPCGGAFPAN